MWAPARARGHGCRLGQGGTFGIRAKGQVFTIRTRGGDNSHRLGKGALSSSVGHNHNPYCIYDNSHRLGKGALSSSVITLLSATWITPIDKNTLCDRVRDAGSGLGLQLGLGLGSQLPLGLELGEGDYFLT